MAGCRRNPHSWDKVRVKKGAILETRWSLKWGLGRVWVGPKILWHSAVSVSVSQLAESKVSHRTPISQRLHLSLSKSHWLLTSSSNRQRTSYSSDTHDDNTEIVSNHTSSVQRPFASNKVIFVKRWIIYLFISHTSGVQGTWKLFSWTIGFKILSLYSFIQIFYLWEEKK